MEQLARYRSNHTVIAMRILNPLLGKGLLALVLIPFLLTACAVQTPQSAPVPPNSSSTPTRVSVVRSSFGDISWLMPASWQEVTPRSWTAPVGPLLFLSNAPIIDPCASSYRGTECLKPLAKLLSGGILVTFGGSATVGTPNQLIPQDVALLRECQDMGGEREMWGFFHGAGINACLRGPNFTANQALFQQMMSSMKKS